MHMGNGMSEINSLVIFQVAVRQVQCKIAFFILVRFWNRSMNGSQFPFL